MDRLPTLAAELVRAQVAVILRRRSPAALAAKAATTIIPIVFTAVKILSNWAWSRAITGLAVMSLASLCWSTCSARSGSELMREIVPTATLIAVLLNPTWPTFDTQLNDVQEAARTVGQQIHIVRANTEREIDAAFDTWPRGSRRRNDGRSERILYQSGATRSLDSRHAMHCRRFTASANLWLPAP